VQLNGYELHIYNRSDLYDKLEKTFGLEPSLLIPTDVLSTEERNKLREHNMNMENARQSQRVNAVKNSEAMQATTWQRTQRIANTLWLWRIWCLPWQIMA